MISEEEIQRYLPKYLSPESYREIISELRDFPDNLDKRLYSLLDDNILFQGDIIKDFPIIDLTCIDYGMKLKNAIILSNTCDICYDNNRSISNNIVYAPLVELDKFISVLQNNGLQANVIKDQVTAIKQQRNTSILFLPASGTIKDSIVLLDNLFNIKTSYIKRNTITNIRLASLSNYGFYLLLFKLSIHFCRMQERVDRKPIAV